MAEWPWPTLDGKVAAMPEIDDRTVTFLCKFVKDPKKGIDRFWQACQDKLLDTADPLTKIWIWWKRPVGLVRSSTQMFFLVGPKGP